MIALALILGYLVGSIPTSVWLGRLWGVDLRADGTTNPGANNARALGGYPLAALVLVMELVKGLAAVAVGLAIGDDPGAVAAGLGAIAGNVYNVWFRFEGGKGLSITGGVLLGIWPVIFPVVVVVIIVSWALTKSSGRATLATLVVLIASALAWDQVGITYAWGVEEPRLLLIAAVGITLLLFPKHFYDARHPIN
ncbi:MAG TPA: glycerol-3-phosphate acyltransferase [Acidimicrobiia bacterium]|nr:glycerol-3-phosphate acyltransferase [Acidimicrobiia bacterium]